jgi:tetratricopeptide (TPR) repeat protein
MKPWILLPLAVAAAVPTRLVLRPTPPARAQTTATGFADAERLLPALDALEERAATVAQGVRDLGARPTSAAAVAEIPDDEEIDAAVARWLERNALDQVVLVLPPEPIPLVDDSTVRDLSMDQILAFFEGREAFEEEGELMYQALRDAGRMDEYVAAVEARVEADPTDSELHTDLGHAYLQKLFGLGATPEAGQVAMMADEAFDAALELDPRNIEARFTKSVALSNWPPFMGKTGEAIEGFEILIAQIEEPGSGHEIPEAYLFLGGVYQRSGEQEKAIETWRSGLDRHPDNEELRAQVELLESSAADE